MWKIPYGNLPKQSSKKFASEPPKLLRSPSRSGPMRKLVAELSYFGSHLLTLMTLSSSLVCQTPFAGLLLRQGDGFFSQRYCAISRPPKGKRILDSNRMDSMERSRSGSDQAGAQFFQEERHRGIEGNLS